MVILNILSSVMLCIALMIIVNIITEVCFRGVLKALGKNPDDYIIQLNKQLDEMKKESPNYSSYYAKSFSKTIEVVEATIKHKYGSNRMHAFTISVGNYEEELIVSKEDWGRFKIDDRIFVDRITSVNLINTNDVRKEYRLSERGAVL